MNAGSTPDNVENDTETIVGSDTTTDSIVGSKACSLCGVAFNTVQDQRGHVRSDLHGYNLKQRLRGTNTVSEVEFENLIGNLDESLSGSDSSDSEDDENGNARKETTLSALLKKQAAISSNDTENPEDLPPPKNPKKGSGKAPLYWFTTPLLPTNFYLGMYRAIFTAAEQGGDASLIETIQSKQLVPKPMSKVALDSNGIPLPAAYEDPHIFLCMIGGGHFAAMVVSLTPKQSKSNSSGPLTREATVLAHKTFHRYTTRRKQGGGQAASDASNGAAKSAGSTLRRFNERALTEEVRQLLQDWRGMIDTSELIFVRASGNTSRRTLYGPYEGQPLRLSDPRHRGFPFNTRRATQNELMRAFVELTRVKVMEVDEAAIAAKAAAEVAAKQSAAAKANKIAGPTVSKISEEEETALLHTSQIQALVKRSKVPALLSYLKSNDLSPDFSFHPSDSQTNHHTPTALHLAASQNSAPLISGLLNKAGANPTLLNGDQKTAFELAGDRPTRDAFRVSRSELGEKKWDWEAAHVPTALSKKEAEERDALEKKEEAKKEEERRAAEARRLKDEGPKVSEGPLGKSQGRGRERALGHVQKTAQDKRDEEARGMTPEMRMKLERERRARAAEERMKRAAGS